MDNFLIIARAGWEGKQVCKQGNNNKN